MRILHLLAVTVLLLLGANTARGDENANIADARDLFEEGLKRMDVEDFEKALFYFRKSRDIRANMANTLNAAHCLGMLGRYDEALELYDELLVNFKGDIDADGGGTTIDRIKFFVGEYRKKTSQLDVTANVDGKVLIDGRFRGDLPLRTALYVLPGKHAVRITKTGYGSYEKTIMFVIGRPENIAAKLEPLVDVGRLRVEVDPKGALAAGGKLWIDGSPVEGSLPWENNLAPGEHLIFASSGDIGSRLVRVNIIQSQLVVRTVDEHPLGAPIRIKVEPLDAELSIDDVVIGKGGFDGRLPIGPYEVSVQARGYKTARFTLQSANDTPFVRVVSLAPEPTHPLWRKSARPLLVARSFEVTVAPLFASSLQSSAEKKAIGGPVYGGLGLVRLGLSNPGFPSLTFNVSFGYLGTKRSVTRSFRSSFEVEGENIPIRFDLQDNLYTYGPFVTLGLDKRLPFYHRRLELRLGLGAGLGLLTSGDLTITAATSRGSTMMANTKPNSDPESSLMVLLTPEVDLKYKLGPVDIRAGLMVVASLLDGKNWSAREIRLTGCTADTNPTDVSCAQSIQLDERSFGRFVAWAPRISIGRSF